MFSRLSMCVLFSPIVWFQERRHRSKLPRALRGLMGEANIRYARGEKDDAILMCMEIIRQGTEQLVWGFWKKVSCSTKSLSFLFVSQLLWPTSRYPHWL